MEIRDQINKRNVLVAVDVQHDFIDGSLKVEEGAEVVAPLNEMAERVRATNLGRVAYTRDWHPSKTPHFDTWPVHCVQDTPGAAFHAELDVRAEDVIINKGMGQTDGYSGTEGASDNGQTLEEVIEPNGSERVRVFVGGLATDYCVKATAIGIAEIFAQRQNVEFYAVKDAMRAVAHDDTEAVKAMADAGVKIIDLERAFTLIDEHRIEK